MNLEEASQLLSNWIHQNPAEVAAKKAAGERYGKLFRPDNIGNITQDDFRGFLTFKNNKHWRNIQRQKDIYADMEQLQTLAVLLEETKPIQDRLDTITDKKNGPPYIKGLGRAVLTPILMCVYPDKYAVYNRISEGALIRLGFAKPKPKDSIGKRYLTINAYCHQIATTINQPLRLVDLMFSKVFRLQSDEEE